MFQALIFICMVMAGGPPECDEAHAIFTDVAPDRYATAEECQHKAIEYLHTVDFEGVLLLNEQYQITVSCRTPGERDGI
jgi:hypothetical protein